MEIREYLVQRQGSTIAHGYISSIAVDVGTMNGEQVFVCPHKLVHDGTHALAQETSTDEMRRSNAIH